LHQPDDGKKPISPGGPQAVGLKTAFGFFLRLFGAFLVSKVVLGGLGAETPVMLLGLALLLVLGSYGGERWGAQAGWVLGRFLIRLNQLPSRRDIKNPSRD
jgi:hypothetical protein